MKFNCGPTKQERENARRAERERKKEWHDFFTIIPRQVASRDCRFLETIERKGYWDYWEDKMLWEYRAKGTTE
jgi:hypothetical protein